MSLLREVEITIRPLHACQQKIWDERVRFNVICCGRRFGKSVLSQEALASPDDKTNGFVHGWPVAYMTPTYKMLADPWREIQDVYAPLIKRRNEQEKRLEFFNGGSLDFWSLEEPESIRGRKYKRVVVDETAAADRHLKLKENWTKIIRPTLTDLKGDGFFLSTPKGKNNYFYTLFEREKKFPNWKSWQFTSYDNPNLDPQEIDDAKNELDPLSFAQEYLATFVTENLDAWAYCYEPEKHLGKTTIDPTREVYLSFDFNKNPITCGVYQHYGPPLKPHIRAIQQIKLPNSDIYKLCDYIRATYGGRLLIVTGDATGKAGSALVQDNINYYTVIKSQLKLSQGQIKVPNVNPPVKENRVLFNSILHNHDFLADPDNCKGLIFDLEHARTLPDGSLEKMDRKDPTQQLDALDCCRYYFNQFHKNLLRV